MLIPGNDETIATGRVIRQRGHWYRPIQCSICTALIWLHLVILHEPDDAPEPHREWQLCKHCYAALLKALSNSTVRSPLRLRIAMGLVAAERSPLAYPAKTLSPEEQQLKREFSWFAWAMFAFAALHLVILLIIWTVPR